MSRFEQGHDNGSCRPNNFSDEFDHFQWFQEGSTLSFGGVSNSLPLISGQWSSADTVENLELCFLYGGQDGGQPGAVTDHQLFDSQMNCSFQTTDDQLFSTYATMQHLMPETSSHDSGTVSDSTYACTLSSFAEHGDSESAEDLNDVISPWLPEPHRHRYHPDSTNGAVSTHLSAEIIPSATDQGVDSHLPAARRWPNYVRLVLLLKRGRRRGKRKRSTEESNKHPCEIRISKKIPRDGRYLKEKAWIGTFATPAQRDRALDVGKYFLSTKRRKNFSDPTSEVTLAAFKDRLQELPLTELVENVRKLAKYYGETGSLPHGLGDL